MNAYHYSDMNVTKPLLYLPVHNMEGDTTELNFQFNITAGTVGTITPETSISGLKDTWVSETPLTINAGTGSVLFTAEGALTANYIRFVITDAVGATILVQGREQQGGGSGGGAGQYFPPVSGGGSSTGKVTTSSYEINNAVGATTNGAKSIVFHVMGVGQAIIDGLPYGSGVLDTNGDTVTGLTLDAGEYSEGYDPITVDATGTIVRITETL